MRGLEISSSSRLKFREIDSSYESMGKKSNDFYKCKGSRGFLE